MRICLVHRDIHQVTRGGICTIYRALAPRLAARGHDVTVITQATPHRVRAPGAKLIVLPRTSDLTGHRRAIYIRTLSTAQAGKPRPSITFRSRHRDGHR